MLPLAVRSAPLAKSRGVRLFDRGHVQEVQKRPPGAEVPHFKGVSAARQLLPLLPTVSRYKRRVGDTRPDGAACGGRRPRFLPPAFSVLGMFKHGIV